MSTMTCGYCNTSFVEDQGQPTCSGCPLKGGCRYVRCPHCGYENPCEPEFMARLKRWLKSDDARAAGYVDEAVPDAREELNAR